MMNEIFPGLMTNQRTQIKRIARFRVRRRGDVGQMRGRRLSGRVDGRVARGIHHNGFGCRRVLCAVSAVAHLAGLCCLKVESPECRSGGNVGDNRVSVGAARRVGTRWSRHVDCCHRFGDGADDSRRLFPSRCHGHG